jgi:hypothetical protein
MASLHHDISTVTGEAVILSTLEESPFGTSKKQERCLAHDVEPHSNRFF